MQELNIVRLRKCAEGTCWDVGNKVLYNLCKRYPYHTNLNEVLAKIWLIGRSYAAAVERRPSPDNKSGDGDNFYIKVVGPAMLEADIDTWLRPLKEITRPSLENAAQIIAVHKKLTDVFCKITGHDKRSLASKYLHFHFPRLFYLYDSRAAKELGKIKVRRPYGKSEEYDRVYAAHFLKCLDLVNTVEAKHEIIVHPRTLDNYFLGYG